MKNFDRYKIAVFILLSFQFVSASAFSLKEDSLSSKFPLNDPRNPSCPCHKYQKLADDEFEKLYGRSIALKTDKINTNYTNTFTGNSDNTIKTSNASKKFRLRNNFFKNFYHKKKKGNKRKKVRRLRRDNTACYHF